MISFSQATGSLQAAQDQAADPAPGGTAEILKIIIPLHNFATKITLGILNSSQSYHKEDTSLWQDNAE